MNTENPPMSSARIHADMLTKAGYAVMDRVLPDSTIAALNETLAREYGQHFTSEVGREGALRVGDRRHLITLTLSGVFGDAALYANPAVMEVMAIIFDGDYVLDNFGVILSLPGSELQHRHRDGKFLFEAGIASMLPVHAVTVAIPLLDMNALHGTTEIFPGSHRISRWQEGSPSVVPDVAAGSCAIWDFRVLHRGTENRSNRCRPLLCMTYSKPWWRDWTNYQQVWTESGPVRPQERLRIGEGFFQTVPEHAQFLFRSVGA